MRLLLLLLPATQRLQPLPAVGTTTTTPRTAFTNRSMLLADSAMSSSNTHQHVKRVSLKRMLAAQHLFHMLPLHLVEAPSSYLSTGGAALRVRYARHADWIVTAAQCGSRLSCTGLFGQNKQHSVTRTF